MSVDVDGRPEGWPRRQAPSALLAVWGDRRSVGLIGAVVVVYLFVTLLDQQVASVGIPLQLRPGLVVVLGLLLGPIAAWGVAIGHVLTDLAGMTLAFDTVVGFLGQFILALIAFKLWGTFGIASRDEAAGARSPRNVVEYGLVAITATVFVVAASAWGHLLVGATTFPAFMVDALPTYLLSVLVVGPVLLYSITTTVDRYGLRYRHAVGTPVEAGPRRLMSALLLVVSLGWAIAGFAIGIVFQAVELEYPHILVNRLGRWVLPVIDVAGPGGIYAQIVAGIFALGICLWGLTRL